MDFTGKPMRGFLFVAAPGVRTAAGVKRWVARAAAHAATLPARKRPKARPRPRAKKG
jgi:hypothetical protein